MKLLAVLAVLVTVSAAETIFFRDEPLPLPLPLPLPVPLVEEIRVPILPIAKHIPIVKHIMETDNLGTFALETEGADGTIFVKQGQLKNLGGPEGPVAVMSGSYSYISPEGIPIAVNWVADELGFRAVGDHLPIPPPLPVAVPLPLPLALPLF